jgi:hypothetical protein
MEARHQYATGQQMFSQPAQLHLNFSIALACVVAGSEPATRAVVEEQRLFPTRHHTHHESSGVHCNRRVPGERAPLGIYGELAAALLSEGDDE